MRRRGCGDIGQSGDGKIRGGSGAGLQIRPRPGEMWVRQKWRVLHEQHRSRTGSKGFFNEARGREGEKETSMTREDQDGAGPAGERNAVAGRPAARMESGVPN